MVHAEEPSHAWLGIWLGAREEDAAVEPARAILERVSRPRDFACLWHEGAVRATALATRHRGWLGISCLAVHGDARRQGLARALLGAPSSGSAGTPT